VKRSALLAAAAIGVAVILAASAGATNQSLAAQLSTRVGANLYLVQHGLSPRGFVIQRGARNYAGPSCPGAGWNCTTAKRVLQISTHAGQVNQTTCSAGAAVDQPGDCEIVQASDGGDNTAECDQGTGDVQGNVSAGASQKCVIFQKTTGSGANTAGVTQIVDTTPAPPSETFVPPPPPASQAATQYAGINQQSEDGSNVLDVGQSITLVETTGSGSTQTENATQQLSVTQKSTTGANRVENGDGAASQSLSENASYDANEGQTITQDQNASSEAPNTNAGITQTSASGDNSINLDQSNDLQAFASGSSSNVTQHQGTTQGGINIRIDQQSTGLSTVANDQTETQNEDTSGLTSTEPVVSQLQFGPMFIDPQGTNPGDSMDLSQSSTQTATDPTTQNDQTYMECASSGNCGGGMTIDQDGHGFGQSCPGGNTCHIGMNVTNKTDVTCSGAACPQAPAGPPPPQQPSTAGPTCVRMGGQDGPPKEIFIEVQSDAGISTGGIQVDAITNARADIPDVSGSTSPVIVTAIKIDQSQSSFIRLTITDAAGAQTTCDPIVPALHARHAVKARARTAKAAGLTLKVDAARLVYGQDNPLTITGSVPSGKAGERVALLTATCGFKGTAQFASVKTGPGGVFQYRFAPAIDAKYAVRWNGRTSASKTVRVQPQVAVARLGKSRFRIDVSTTNGVFLTGTPVTLQALVRGHWQTVGRGKLAPNSPADEMTAISSATIAQTATARQLRALVPQTTCYSGATSATVGG